MVLLLAEANTSAGAPDAICSANPELGPKLKTTFVPGFFDSNWRPNLVNDSWREAAAKTLMVPVADDDGLELPEPEGAPP